MKIQGRFTPSEELGKLNPSFLSAVTMATRLKDEGTVKGDGFEYSFTRTKVGSFETITFGSPEGVGIGMIMTDLRNFHHRVLEARDQDFYEAMCDIVSTVTG